MSHPGWILVVMGALLLVIGMIWIFVPLTWFGRLPGDIVVERENFRFYFPLVTCILLSAVLTGIFWLIRLFTR